MIILGIDPGQLQTGYALFDPSTGALECSIEENRDILALLRTAQADLLAYEMIASYGMPVGAEVFDTVFWTGRFFQAWRGKSRSVYRREVKLTLCGDPRAKDANIRQAVMDYMLRYGRGGGKRPAIGTKDEPGPCYGVSRDMWSAIAVAITAAERMEETR